MSFIQGFRKAFYQTYLPDGVDRHKGTVNGIAVRKNEISAIASEPISHWTSFLGLPNHLIYKGTAFALNRKHLVGNFFGQKPYMSMVARIFFGVILTTLHLITVPLKFATNLLKLPEVLFLGLGNGLANYGDAFEKSEHRGTKVLGIVLGTLSGLSNLAHILVRAVSSPIESVRSAWLSRHVYTDEQINARPRLAGRKKAINGVASVVLSLFSIAVTVIACALLFPLAVHLAVVHLPALTSAIVNAPVAAWFATAVKGVVFAATTVGEFVVAHTALSALGFVAAAPGWLGAGIFAALGLTTVGAVIDRIQERVRNWWHTTAFSPAKVYGRVDDVDNIDDGYTAVAKRRGSDEAPAPYVAPASGPAPHAADSAVVLGGASHSGVTHRKRPAQPDAESSATTIRPLARPTPVLKEEGTLRGQDPLAATSEPVVPSSTARIMSAPPAILASVPAEAQPSIPSGKRKIALVNGIGLIDGGNLFESSAEQAPATPGKKITVPVVSEVPDLPAHFSSGPQPVFSTLTKTGVGGSSATTFAPATAAAPATPRTPDVDAALAATPPLVFGNFGS